MDTELLRILLLIAEEGSISGAAQRLHFSQPAASKRLRVLEDQLGEQLFLRHNRGVELTEAGKIMKDYAERIIQLEDALLEDLEALRSPGPRVIEIIATQFVASSLLPCLLWSFHEDEPAISTRLTTAPAETALRLIRENSAPLGFIEGPVDDEDLAVQRIGEEPLVLVGNPNLVAEVLEGLSKALLLLPDPGTGVRRTIEAAMAHGEVILHGVTTSPIEGFHSLDSLKVAAMNGLGLVLMPRVLVQRDLLEGSLVLCPASENQPAPIMSYAFVWRRERKLSPEYREVIDHSMRCCAPIPVGATGARDGSPREVRSRESAGLQGDS